MTLHGDVNAWPVKGLADAEHHDGVLIGRRLLDTRRVESLRGVLGEQLFDDHHKAHIRDKTTLSVGFRTWDHDAPHATRPL